MNKKITVFGLGYVGMSIAVLLAQKNQVIGIDLDKRKVEQINLKNGRGAVRRLAVRRRAGTAIFLCCFTSLYIF